LTPVLLDAGAIVAVLDRRERRHAECMAILEKLDAPLVTCEAVIAEACHLTRRIHGANGVILENIEAGIFQVPFRLADCTRAITKIIRKYSDRSVDLADACLVHLATELRTGEILTLDRDFLVYRWGANHPFHPLIRLDHRD
jgi:predicted nucleic acid-binding protein